MSDSGKRDLGGKRDKYDSVGVASYWVIDPEEPSTVAWDLVHGRYQAAGEARGDQDLTLGLPFPITLNLAHLMARYGW